MDKKKTVKKTPKTAESVPAPAPVPAPPPTTPAPAPAPAPTPDPIPMPYVPEPQVPPPADTESLSPETKTTLAGTSSGEIVPLERTNRRLMKIGVGMVIIIVALVAGVYYLWTNLKKQEVKPLPVVEVAPNPSTAPIASSGAELRRSEISVEILNGSGKTGKAGEVARGLAELGYQADKVGNAPEEASSSTVYLSAKAETWRAEIMTDLSFWGIKTVAELVGGTTEVKIILGADVK